MVRQGQDWRRVGLDDRHAFKRIDAASELNTQRAQRSFNSLISYPHGLTLASATLDHVIWSNHGAGQANFRRIHERKSRAKGYPIGQILYVQVSVESCVRWKNILFLFGVCIVPMLRYLKEYDMLWYRISGSDLKTLIFGHLIMLGSFPGLWCCYRLRVREPRIEVPQANNPFWGPSHSPLDT